MDYNAYNYLVAPLLTLLYPNLKAVQWILLLPPTRLHFTG
jgi:hypothetical protein